MAEGNGLENRQAGKTVRGFGSHILLPKVYKHNTMFVSYGELLKRLKRTVC